MGTGCAWLERCNSRNGLTTGDATCLPMFSNACYHIDAYMPTHTHTQLTNASNHPPLKADCPDTSRLPSEDILGVTVVLLTCSYRSQEFVRVGYYVNNEYDNPEMNENPPDQPQYDKVHCEVPWTPHGSHVICTILYQFVCMLNCLPFHKISL